MSNDKNNEKQAEKKMIDIQKDSLVQGIKKRLTVLRERFLGGPQPTKKAMGMSIGFDEKSTRWSDWEGNDETRYPGLWHITKISEVTGCSLDWLIFGKGEYTPPLKKDDNGKESLSSDLLDSLKEAEWVEDPIKIVGNCPKCGAPIYGRKKITPKNMKDITYSCDCRLN